MADSTDPNGGVARRALVLGGAGFIGSTLVDRLLSEGWQVAVMDAFEPFYARERKIANLASARDHPAFSFVEGDTREISATRSAAALVRPSVIFDFAARGGVRDSLTDPWLYIGINVTGLQNSLRVAAESGARYVFASSSSVYGDDDRQPFVEDQMRSRPESPYGATKVAGEALVHAHHAVTKLPVGIARFFTVYGPRQRPDLAIHKFAVAILKGEPIDLYDEGRPLRDYTYVDDIVDGLIRLANVAEPYLLVNLGSNHPVTVSQLVDSLESLLGVQAERVLRPRQPGDVPATYADISRAREHLGWQPRMSFEEGLKRFRAWLLARGR